jgi:hypothetical protein
MYISHSAVHTSSETQPTFQSVGNEGFLPIVKAAGHKVDLSPVVSADVKNEGSYTPASLTCLQGMGTATMTWYLYTTIYIQQIPSREVADCLIRPVFPYLSSKPQTHDHLHKT